MSRIPQVRDLLDVTPSELGRILFALAAGSVAALPSAGLVVSKIGSARTVACAGIVTGGGLSLVGLGSDVWTSSTITTVGLTALGYGWGTWDVAMNVEGAAVERRLGRAIMPRFHAAWSLGTIAGGGIGVGATAFDIPVSLHLILVGAGTAAIVVVAIRGFLSRGPVAEGHVDTTASASSMWTAWREPRTLLIGVLVLCFTLIEGVANDWLALGIVDGYRTSHAAGSGAFAIFVTAMMGGRSIGTHLIDRYGRLPVLHVSAALAAAGVILVVFGGSLAIAAIGIIIWGFGASLGFPLGMSAASDDPRRAAARVSVVASIGYTGFLAGPPVLGYIGNHQGVLHALIAVAGAAVLSAFVAPAARERQ
jgi:fucose permease